MKSPNRDHPDDGLVQATETANSEIYAKMIENVCCHLAKSYVTINIRVKL